MQLEEIYFIYPEGDHREIDRHLRVNQLVDLNGRPLPLPLPTSRMIAYRVYRKSTDDQRGLTRTFYFGELVPAAELQSYT